jgi:DNA-binding response OmpR family regulator
MSGVAAGCLGHFLDPKRRSPIPRKARTSKPTAVLAPRVLSIEDDVAMGQFLKAVFTSQGFSIEVATDGREGLAVARREPPDLIILDLLMPYKNGFEVLRELREDPATRSVPVIFLSSNSREEDIVKALTAGADDFVVKPFRARELVARVRKVLGRSRVER